MKPLELAKRYMEIFYSGQSPGDLRSLFSDDFSFKGPLYQFNTPQAYLDSLKAAPPQGFEYTIRHEYESGNSACLIYDFSKPGVSTPMAQVFIVHEDKISDIELIFDAQDFLPEPVQ